ncbi:MAG: Uma2 family endonuclease [Steroidobacteraceae bacterium]
MNTLSEVEDAILRLSQVECDRLIEWLEALRRNRLRVSESAVKYRAAPQAPMTFEEYLELEANSRIRHEYLAGEVFGMCGVTPRHNRIASRLHGAFRDHLKGGPCESYMSDVAVKLRMSRDDYAYYPDVMVVCGREKGEERFFTDPKLIVEVLSPSTASVDRHEKRIAYRRIPALEEYVIVAQDVIELTVFRRDGNWSPVALDALDSILNLRSIGLALPLARIYEGEAI